MSVAGQIGQPSLKVPRDDNTWMCWPQLTEAASSLDHALLSPSDVAIERSPFLQSLRSAAREQAVRSAIEYTRSYVDTPDDEIASDPNHWLRAYQPADRLTLGGHQPELFHPGVWYKNFVLNLFAKRTQGRSLHVIIDHDLARSESLRVPAIETPGHGLSTHLVRLPMRNDGEPRLPWHATRGPLGDSHAWEHLSQQIATLLRSCGANPPLIADYAATLDREIAQGRSLADGFSRLRHRIELQHGIRNLEVPIGRLCSQSAFAIFLHHCLLHADPLRAIYNERRSEYRREHRIRNQAHPVLELEKVGDWIELPFWLYHSDRPDRKRLWVRQDDERLFVRQSPEDSQSIETSFPAEPHAFQKDYLEKTSHGLCVRTRALMTTMFLRCFIADTFLHGIGGGAYDRLTDRIIADFLGIEPPKYLITSASIHLPLGPHASDSTAELELQQQELHRDSQQMRSRPELFLDPMRGEHHALRQEHHRLLAEMPAKGHRKKWRSEMIALRTRICEAVKERSDAIRKATVQLALKRQQHAIVASREYSLALFDESDIVDRLRALAEQAMV